MGRGGAEAEAERASETLRAKLEQMPAVEAEAAELRGVVMQARRDALSRAAGVPTNSSSAAAYSLPVAHCGSA